MKKNIISLLIFWLSLIILFIYIDLQQNIYITDPQISDLYLSLAKTGISSIICYILTGFSIIFITETRKKGDLLILDILFLDIPCLILVSSALFILSHNNILTRYLWVNRNLLTIHGALFLSCEIYRYITFRKARTVA